MSCSRSIVSGIAVPGLALLALGAIPCRALASDRNQPLPFPPGADQPLTALQDVEVVEHLGDKIPNGLSFRDPSGAMVDIDAMLGQKPILFTLGYYRCPMLCSLIRDGLTKAMKDSGLVPGKDFQAISISIDPNEDAKLARETQERTLKAFGGQVKPEDWPFLLGDATASRALADAVGFRYAYDDTSRQFAHVAVSFVLTPKGRISRYLYGVEVIPRDFRLAMVEAGGGRVGTSFDRILLSCFQYDPVNRRYGPYLFAFVRIGAGLVFLSLLALIVLLWRKERAMKRRRVA